MYSGCAHGSHDEKSFVFQKAVNFKPGKNHIALLGMTVGLPVKILIIYTFPIFTNMDIKYLWN